jgi:hypothetical protein
MNGRAWFRAHIRWAVMVEGKEGLRGWEESVYFFLSENEETAFQQALEIGRGGERYHQEGRRSVETRLAEILELDWFGKDQTEFEVSLGFRRGSEKLPFEHVFDPEGKVPTPAF